MKRSIARKWAKALESGEYKQAKGALRKSGGFCCLGVLCNLHAQEHPEIAEQQKDKGSYLGQSGFLPKEVMEWVRMGSNDGALPQQISGHWHLTGLNDGAKLTFPEIAKVIRKHWKEL